MAKNNYNDYKNLVGQKIQIKTENVIFNVSQMKLDTNGLVESKILGIVLMNGKWYFIIELNDNTITKKIPCKELIGKIDSVYFLSKKEKNVNNNIVDEEKTDDSFINELLDE